MTLQLLARLPDQVRDAFAETKTMMQYVVTEGNCASMACAMSVYASRDRVYRLCAPRAHLPESASSHHGFPLSRTSCFGVVKYVAPG